MGALTLVSGVPRMVAVVDACQGCGACLLTCPEHAIQPRGGGVSRLAVLADRCSGCGECVEVCPVDVIDLVARRADGGAS